MSHRISRALVGLTSLGLLACTPAFAATSPWYGGANVGFTSASGFGNGTSFGLYGGYRLPVHIWRLKTAVEVGYDHFGSMNENGLGGTGYTGTLTGHDIAASVIFTYPFTPAFGAYVRAGLADTSLTETLSGNGVYGYGSASGVNALFGIGANYQITPVIGVHAEYRNTGASTGNGFSTGSVDSFLVGATYNF